MSDVKRLLDEATPLPWGVSSRSVGRSYIGKGPKGGGLLLAETWDVNHAKAPREGNAALIVHAVNHLPDYEAAVDALERLLTHAVPHLRGETSPTAMQSDPRLWSSVQKGRAALRRLRGDE